MAVDGEDVRPSVPVEVEKLCTPSDMVRGGCQSGGHGSVPKEAAPLVAEEAGSLDPYSARTGPDGNALRDPFRNNVIPQGRLDPGFVY